MKKLEDIIDIELRISIPNTKENISILKKNRYMQMCGSCAYKRPYLVIQPFKRIFWEDNIQWKINTLMSGE
jgi:hypothetical protein